MRLSLAASLVVAALAPGIARADDAIAWVAPRGCPAPDAVRARVEANLGRAIRDGEVHARLLVRGRGRRWTVTMTVALGDGPPGERELAAGSCAELAESAALILALTIDPFAGEPAAGAGEPDPGADPEIEILEPPGEPAGTVDDESPPVPDLTRRHVDDPDGEAAPPLPTAVRVRAGVGGDLGSLPGAASAWSVAAELTRGPWSIDVGASRFAGQRAEAPGMPGVGAIVGLTSVDVRGCYTGGAAPWRAGGCVGVDAAVTSSEGFGFGVNEPRTTVGGGFTFGATWGVRVLGPIGVRVDLGATWQVARTVLTTGDGLVIHDPDSLIWRGVTSVEAVFDVP